MSICAGIAGGCAVLVGLLGCPDELSHSSRIWGHYLSSLVALLHGTNIVQSLCGISPSSGASSQPSS